MTDGTQAEATQSECFHPASFSGTTKQTKTNTFAISETLYQALLPAAQAGLADITQNHTAAPFEAVVKAEMSHAHRSNSGSTASRS